METEIEQKLIEEYRQTLKRAFKGQPSDAYILMDGRQAQGKYLRDSWNYYHENGYITTKNVELEQNSFIKGYITDKGKEWIL